jgi:hypothetical protein
MRAAIEAGWSGLVLIICCSSFLIEWAAFGTILAINQAALTAGLKDFSRTARTGLGRGCDLISLRHWVKARPFVGIWPDAFQHFSHSAFERAHPIAATEAHSNGPFNVDAAGAYAGFHGLANNVAAFQSACWFMHFFAPVIC